MANANQNKQWRMKGSQRLSQNTSQAHKELKYIQA